MSKRLIFVMKYLGSLAAMLLVFSQLTAAERLLIPLGRTVTIPSRGVEKILAVEEGVVDIVNVSEEDIIIAAIGLSPGTTQLILWDNQGRRVYDVTTYSEEESIVKRFHTIVGSDDMELVIFPDSVYLRGKAKTISELEKAKTVAQSLIGARELIDLLELEDFKPGLGDKIQLAINLPDVDVRIIERPSGSTDQTQGGTSDSSDNYRVILEGKVQTQNQYMRMVEIVRSFVDSDERISNLVTIENPIQVVFQAYVLDVSKDNTDELGIEWGREGTPGTLLFRENVSNHFRGDVQSQGAPVPSSVNPFYANNINRFDLIAAQVRAWETSGVAKVLANPNLTVYANPTMLASRRGASRIAGEQNDSDRALVRVGREIGFQVTNPQGGTEDRTIDADLVLEIEKLFIDGDSLKFNVHAEQAEPVFRRGVDSQPDILRREVRTTVQTRNEETIAIGGLINRKESTSISRVPLLGDLPLVGGLFRSRSKSREENELIILLTPRIMDSQESFDAVEESHAKTKIPEKCDRLHKLHDLFQEIRNRE